MSGRTTPRNLVAVGLLVVLGFLAVRSVDDLLANPASFPPHDFVEYWCAGTLNLAGGDPYDAAAMYDLQTTHLGWEPVPGQPVMMWNPPWTLTLAMPLAWLPWQAAQLAWLAVRLAVLAVSAHLLARNYGRPAWAVTFTWVPCYVALQYGQVSPFLLLGAALFVDLGRRGRRFAAGFACVLLAVKPHLAVLFWLAVGLHAVRTREWRIVAGGVAGGLAFSAWPLLMNPHVFAQYFASARANPPTQWMSPTLGTLLRLIFGAEHFWLQFVPLLPALAWFGWHAARTRPDWNWAEQTPVLLFASFVAAPYGAWPYDLTLLVLPFAAVAARGMSPALIAVYVLVNVGILACIGVGLPAQAFVWVAPAALVGTLTLARPRDVVGYLS